MEKIYEMKIMAIILDVVNSLFIFVSGRPEMKIHLQVITSGIHFYARIFAGYLRKKVLVREVYDRNEFLAILKT